MIPTLIAVLAEAFLQGAATAVSIFLLWKDHENRKEE